MKSLGKMKNAYSDDVKDILSMPPSSLTRWGSTVIFIIIVTLTVGCFIIKYPDTISCQATISPNDPPIWIVSKYTGKIKNLYVKDQQHVNKDEIIAVIENPAETKDVLTIDSFTKSIKINETPINTIKKDLQIGDIQESYNNLLKSIINYNNFINNNLYDQQITAQEKQIKPYNDYVSSVAKQVELGNKQNSIETVNYQREKDLHDKGLTSTADLENEEKNLINTQINLAQAKSTLANAKIQAATVESNISELQVRKEQERRDITTTLENAVKSLKNSITTWKQTFALISPIDGIVSYNNVWKENQTISQGEIAFAITSKNNSSCIVKAKIPITGIGKVRKGNKVNIILDGYPHMEFGYLKGEVLSISPMFDDNGYTATIDIKSETTTYGKKIPLDKTLAGTAEIITDDLSIAIRLLAPLRYFFKHNIET